jgi:hypothetical protein
MRLKAAIAAMSLAAATTLGMVVTTGSAAQAVSCPDNAWDIYDGRIGQYFAGNGINIRTGPSTVCTAVGQGQASHEVQLDCYKEGQNGTWSHLWDFTTARGGWVKDTLLVDAGAYVHC